MSDAQKRLKSDGGRMNGDEEFYSGGVSVFGFVNVLLRHPRLVILMPLLAMATAMVYEMSRGKAEFVAESAFMPQAASPARSALATPGWLPGVGQESQGNSIELYRALVNSRELLRRAGKQPYRIAREGGGDTVMRSLADIYGERDAAAVLSGRVSTGVEPGGILSLRTTARRPELAIQVNQRLLDLLNDFNVRRAQTQAVREADFIESRMHDARGQLEQAEADLQRFLEQNRNYESSPQLAVTRARLQRRVDLRQEIYLSLARSYENVRIEAMRNMPVLTIVEPPEFVGQTTAARPLFVGIIALFATLVLAVAIAYLLEFIARQPEENPEEFREFRELARNSLGGLLPRRAASRRD
jgi:tetratricopeptide (TPR) repeat protein